MSVTGPVDYAVNAVPTRYACAACGASGVRLWREYQTFAHHIALKCAPCSLAEQGQAEPGRGDSIGWRVPAVPTEDGDTYWGYTSVPEAGLEWWRRLPGSGSGRRTEAAMTATRKHRCLGVDEDLRHPIGRLYWQPGEREYHFDPGDEDYRGTERTLCGLVTDQDNVIGTWGIPLSDDALHHEWLVGIDPCKGCFVGDWWKKQGE